MSSRKPRGRVTDESIPKPKMVFGVSEICPWCRGKGHPKGKKEICGACRGSGVYNKESPSEGG